MFLGNFHLGFMNFSFWFYEFFKELPLNSNYANRMSLKFRIPHFIIINIKRIQKRIFKWTNNENKINIKTPFWYRIYCPAIAQYNLFQYNILDYYYLVENSSPIVHKLHQCPTKDTLIFPKTTHQNNK